LTRWEATAQLEGQLARVMDPIPFYGHDRILKESTLCNQRDLLSCPSLFWVITCACPTFCPQILLFTWLLFEGARDIHLHNLFHLVTPWWSNRFTQCWYG
jgi:hypothetical protein